MELVCGRTLMLECANIRYLQMFPGLLLMEFTGCSEAVRQS